MEKVNAETTSLIEVREFLMKEGYGPTPWSPPKSVIDSLYTVLNTRKDDDSFWSELSGLTRHLEDRRFHPLRLDGLEVLDGKAVDKLIGDLRYSLPGGNGKGPSLKNWIQSSVSVTALSGFLLLGTAMGCDGPTESSNGDTDTGTEEGLCQEAKDEDISEAEGEIYCDLVSLIKQANITNDEKGIMFDCLPGLDAAYREELLTTFQSLSDDDLAEELEWMAMPCGDCDPDDWDCH
ncbi:MAG: hypothetical protein GY847_29430 [Proteobacteria bacterium]|nr:hypothetical protein [Pseudomonadota bacterium]